jgi:DNA-binding beta-propeller fold protein YncE
MKNTRNILTATLIAGAFVAASASAQSTAPEIKFDSVANALQLPAGLYLGEVEGVATNSKGDVFVYTRTGHPTVTIGTMRPFAHGGSRLFEFDRTGKFVREVGKDTYAFMAAAQARVDPADNIWVVDEMSNTVMKFDPQGRVAMLLGRKAESENIPARAAGGGDGAGQPTDLFNRPTDVAWDAAGNIFVADGAGNARIAKFDKDGKFVKSWGKRGSAPGEFGNVLSIAVDAQGNVYAGDGGNKRIEVFDNNGTFKTAFSNVGNPQAMCMTKGASPVLYVSIPTPGTTLTWRVRFTKCIWMEPSSVSSGGQESCRRSSALSTPSTAAVRTRLSERLYQSRGDLRHGTIVSLRDWCGSILPNQVSLISVANLVIVLSLPLPHGRGSE